MTNAGRDQYYARGGDGQSYSAASNDPNAPIQIPRGYEYRAPAYQPRNDVAQQQGGGYNPLEPGAPPTPPKYFVRLISKQGQPRCWHWGVWIYSADGGIHQRGDIAEMHNARSTSTGLDGRINGQEFLAQYTSNPAPTDPGASNIYFLSSVNAFGVHAIAPYNDQGSNYTPLYVETAAGTLTQRTYSKAATHKIRGLVNLFVNGTPYVAVLKSGQPIELLSDLGSTPTSAGSMHADTSGAWAACNTTFPDTAILIFQDNEISALSNTAALGTQPTVTGYVPVGGGGHNAKLGSINGGDVRVYFNALAPDSANSQQLPGYAESYGDGTYQGAVYSCTQRGTNVELLKLPMRWVEGFDLIRNGLVAWDGRRIYFYDGRPRDLRIFRDPTIESDYLPMRIAGVHVVNRADLYADILYYNVGGTNIWTRMLYSWARDEWTIVQTTVTVVAGICAGHGSLPVSDSTGYLYQLAYGSSRTWYAQWQPLAGDNPYLNRRTPASTSTTGRQFASTGTSESPYFDIPGIEGTAKTWHRMYFGGQIDVGSDETAKGTVAISVGGSAIDDTFVYETETFTGGMNARDRWRKRQRTSTFRELKFSITLTQGDNTHMTPQALPWFVEGLAYEDDEAAEFWSKPGMVSFA